MVSCTNRHLCYSAQEHCYSPRMWGHVSQIFWLLESNKNACFLCEIAWFLVLFVNLYFKKIECQIDYKEMVNLILYTANCFTTCKLLEKKWGCFLYFMSLLKVCYRYYNHLPSDKIIINNFKHYSNVISIR